VQAHGKERRFLREKCDYDTPEAFADDFAAFVGDTLKSNNRFERFAVLMPESGRRRKAGEGRDAPMGDSTDGDGL